MSDTDPESRLEQAEIRLRQQLGGRVRELRVVVHRGGVTLRGQALSYYAKQLAQHAAMHALGLPVVANDIEVHRAPPVSESEPPTPAEPHGAKG